jgi:hypothetical protein
MQECAAQHLRLCDLAKPKLQPDRKKQEQHPKMCDMVQNRPGFIRQSDLGTHGRDREACGEKAYHRWQAYAANRQTEGECKADADDLDHRRASIAGKPSLRAKAQGPQHPRRSGDEEMQRRPEVAPGAHGRNAVGLRSPT